MTKVFIDGSAGTTGLKIVYRLKQRKDIELITLNDDLRKDINARKTALNSSDIAFLCLPDAAATEAVSLIENPNTAVIDTSTAHRVNDTFTYGFAEINNLGEKIKNAKRIANPGCHASGFIALIAPLVEADVIKSDTALSCFSLTGYSGGGKGMIADYENKSRDTLLDAPRMYGLTQAHKHLPEMVKVTGIKTAPVFCPIVGDFYSGMQVSVPLSRNDISVNLNAIKDIYKGYYQKGLVQFCDDFSTSGFLSANALSDFDNMVITVTGNDERIVLTATYDNLGKGASGSAIENMNILLGVSPDTGLNIWRKT